MKNLILFGKELINKLLNKKFKYIVEIVNNDIIVDKFETMTYSRRIAYKIGVEVNFIKYDGRFELRVYEE
jgi:hypothetical protein